MDNLLQLLLKNTTVLIKWLKDNYLQMNPDKCKLLITNHDEGTSITVDNEVIECSKSVKLLGITIDNKLNFREYATKLCKKASSKLHVLTRISNYMSR